MPLLLVIAITGSPLYWFNFVSDKDFIRILIEAIVQLISFGGIVFGILYPEQRKLIRELRAEKIKWLQRREQFQLNPKRYARKNISQKSVEKRISDLSKEINIVRDAYGMGQVGFLLAFLFLGIDIAALVLHLAFFSTVSGLVVLTFHIDAVVSYFESELLFLGITLLVFGIFKGAFLPEGPAKP